MQKWLIVIEKEREKGRGEFLVRGWARIELKKMITLRLMRQ